MRADSPLDACQRLEKIISQRAIRKENITPRFQIQRLKIIQGEYALHSVYAWIDKSLTMESQTSLWIGEEDGRAKHVSFVSNDPDFPRKEGMDNLEYVGKVNMYLGDSLNPVLDEVLSEFACRPGEHIGPY